MDETKEGPLFRTIDLESEDGKIRYRLKVTNEQVTKPLLAIRLKPDGKGGWTEPPPGSRAETGIA